MCHPMEVVIALKCRGNQQLVLVVCLIGKSIEKVYNNKIGRPKANPIHTRSIQQTPKGKKPKKAGYKENCGNFSQQIFFS